MNIESILNIGCSMFANGKATKPATVNLLHWLSNRKHLHQQQQIRNAKDKAGRDALKIFMPCITPSGIFSQRGKNYLVKHTGFIAIDIDLKDNNHIENYHNLKNEVCKILNVAYCGLSVSGTGYWLLIPIAHPDKHEQHFKFIQQYFKSKNLIIDKACSDVARLRFYSYDPTAYFNHAAKPLQTHYTPSVIKPKQLYQKKFNDDNKPVWEQYNEGKYFIDVLQNHGWGIESETGNKKYFTRPGKTSGISAEFDSTKNVFFVFTENGQPFEPNIGYNPFAIYTKLDHTGDFSKAAKSLLQTTKNNPPFINKK